MSSEVHKYIKNTLEKERNLFNADILNFDNKKNFKKPEDLEKNNLKAWKLYDKTNTKEDGDQLKAVMGICFMLASLVIMGLYSNLI